MKPQFRYITKYEEQTRSLEVRGVAIFAAWLPVAQAYQIFFGDPKGDPSEWSRAIGVHDSAYGVLTSDKALKDWAASERYRLKKVGAKRYVLEEDASRSTATDLETRWAKAGEMSEDDAHELLLQAENLSEVANQTNSIITNLAKKHAKGVYDKALAAKLWTYLADATAKVVQKNNQKYGYTKSDGSEWAFTPATRRKVGEMLEEKYFDFVQDEAIDYKRSSTDRLETRGHEPQEMTPQGMRGLLKAINSMLKGEKWKASDKRFEEAMQIMEVQGYYELSSHLAASNTPELIEAERGWLRDEQIDHLYGDVDARSSSARLETRGGRVRLRLTEEGNGFPSKGELIADSDTVYKIVDLDGGSINTDSSGRGGGNWMEVIAKEVGSPFDVSAEEYEAMRPLGIKVIRSSSTKLEKRFWGSDDEEEEEPLKEYSEEKFLKELRLLMLEDGEGNAEAYSESAVNRWNGEGHGDALEDELYEKHIRKNWEGDVDEYTAFLNKKIAEDNFQQHKGGWTGNQYHNLWIGLWAGVLADYIDAERDAIRDRREDEGANGRDND